MTVAYTPPGVLVTEQTSPQPVPLLAIPGGVCLVGLAAGSVTQTDTIQLVGTTGVVLPRVPPGATMTSGSIVSVLDVLNPQVAPSGFVVSTDYTFTPSTYTITRVVTSNTLGGTGSSGASTVTLSSGPVPAAGQVIRLTAGGTTEIVTVASVSGQVVTLATTLVNTYATSSPVTWGNIPDSDEVYVTYTYTPADYFLPVQLSSMSEIETRFGSAWDATNTTINSPLSFAASMAFQNGATTLILQPLYVFNGSGVRIQPNNAQNATASTWSTVFTNLQGIQSIGIVVPVIGQSQPSVTDAIQLQVFEAAQDFIYQEAQGEGQYILGALGEDGSSGSTSVAQQATIISHAQQLQSRYGNAVTKNLVLLNSAQFSVANATSSLTVGGQYVAAGIAAMITARSPSSTLTRQALSGVLAVTDFRSLVQKNTDAQNGLMVVESKGNVVRVRHALTLDMTSVLTRELNVVTGKFYVIESVTQTLDTQVVGQIVADAAAPTLVNNLVIATLEDLRSNEDISDYANVASRILSLDPTTMEVRFDYQPAFMVNYVTLIFSLDLSNQTINVSSPTVSNG